MKVEFVRFQSSDGIELQGWLSDVEGDIAVVHVHGMSGNGYENRFLDALRDRYARQGVSFFAFDNRGRGIISYFSKKNEVSRWGEGTKQGGSCYEIFEESTYDIQGAIEYLKSLGKTRIILQGHSLGCAKVVNYLVGVPSDFVMKVILLAPTDMVGWASRDAKHSENIERARLLMADGNPTELVSAKCWPDETPLSAQTYLSICVAGTASDIYGEREGGALLGRVAMPMLIVYGSDDNGIIEIDGTISTWRMRTEKIMHPSTQISIIENASHSFLNYEDVLADVVERFILVER